MRPELTLSLRVFLDPNSVIYVTHFSEVEYMHSIEVWAFWSIPWIEEFYTTLENERSIKVLW